MEKASDPMLDCVCSGESTAEAICVSLPPKYVIHDKAAMNAAKSRLPFQIRGIPEEQDHS